MKFRFIAIIIGILLLGGCSSVSNSSNNNSTSSNQSDSSPVKVIKDLHEEAYKQDFDAFKKFFVLAGSDKVSDSEKEDQEIKQWMEALAISTHSMGGTNKVKFREIPRKEVSAPESLDKKFKNGWAVVSSSYDFDYKNERVKLTHIWVLKKVEEKYYIQEIKTPKDILLNYEDYEETFPK
ncbi:hypothetical protein [Bacillus wiedmannii]|uniref:hypothetical protein n=1 Tax=Bacillus wiedmannii TaxID=1890302 RepID=UPI003D98098D